LAKVRAAVVGAGEFGKRHLRAVRQSSKADLVGVYDADWGRAEAAAAEYQCRVFKEPGELAEQVDAAIVATPTTTHAEVGQPLLEAGIDLLVEKPISHDLASARRLVETARAHGRILQVGHLERFNPAVIALENHLTTPLFFEVHRLSVFTPRSLDVDVVLDLMIHDLDIVLSIVKTLPEEIRAAGISILSHKVDIANVRLAFAGGCVANFTASRVSTERVRKLRLFQPNEYVSIDYARQDMNVFRVSPGHHIGFHPLVVMKEEPLRLEQDAFFDCVTERTRPRVAGEDGCLALEVALAILAKIEEHSRVVAESLAKVRKP
jgi:predicted dehydrogenase